MKRLLIGLLLVTLLVSGCRQAVVTIPPLSTPIPTTTALTWDSVASLPVGTVVELTGYVIGDIFPPANVSHNSIGYDISEDANWGDTHIGNLYEVMSSTTNPPAIGTLVTIKVRVEGDYKLNLIAQ